MAKSTQSRLQKRPTPFRPWRPRPSPSCRPWPGSGWPPVAAGVRYAKRTDVLLALLAPGTQVAGVFTTSKTASAPRSCGAATS